jgi:hypothetical protein
MPQTKNPSITWGTSFANAISFEIPADSPVSYTKPRDGSQAVQASSGVRDAWIVGTDYVLELDVRWIPTTSTGTQTGWDGTTGWRSFLDWARQANAFRWIPDASAPGTYVTSYLVEPFQQAPSIEPNGFRRLRLVMTNSTTPYDGY